MDESTAPKTAMELAAAIQAFAQSLSTDYDLVSSALTIAHQSIQSDHWNAIRRQRAESR